MHSSEFKATSLSRTNSDPTPQSPDLESNLENREHRHSTDTSPTYPPRKRARWRNSYNEEDDSAKTDDGAKTNDGVNTDDGAKTDSGAKTDDDAERNDGAEAMYSSCDEDFPFEEKLQAVMRQTRPRRNRRRSMDSSSSPSYRRPVESQEVVPDNKFAFSPGQMNKLFMPNSLSTFYALGGLAGLEKGLRTNRQYGLSVFETILDGYISFEDVRGLSTDMNASKALFLQTATSGTTSSPSTRASKPFADRKRVFKDNSLLALTANKSKNIFQLMWMAYNNKVLILLTIAAIVSLCIGLYQTFGKDHTPTNPPVEWIEGVAIIVAIVIIVIVGSINDYQKERQFAKLYKKKQDRNVKVIRSGISQEISVFDVLVGDVLHIEPGDIIPADGIFIDGYNVKCDESSVTGESDLRSKHPADEVFQAVRENEELPEMDPFINSGARVAEGVGIFLVTGTGVNSTYGKILMSLREDPETTPLQSRLNTLAEYIAKFGGAVALLLFAVLFIEFLARLPHSTLTPVEKGQNFVNIIIITLTILVIAIPEGLPLVVTLALAFATTRMLKDLNLVRRLRACETMGNATDVCSNKTGTLTQNKMTIVAGIVGTKFRFVDPKSNFANPSNLAEKYEHTTSNGIGNVSTNEVKYLANDVKKLLEQSLIINSTTFEGDKDGKETFIGSTTETTLLEFAQDYLGIGSIRVVRSHTKVVQLIPFDSSRKYMAAVVKLENGQYRLYVKGAPEILLAKCTRIIDDPTKGVSDVEISMEHTEYLDQMIAEYGSLSLRTIGLFYCDLKRWPLSDVHNAKNAEVVPEKVLNELVFLGVFGIQNPLRDGIREAVRMCQKAGVIVRMVTSDDVWTAKAIAKECGILSVGGMVMKGADFRKLILARSSPADKQMLVLRLKHLGRIVAVTGDGTNDAPALTTADIGFSMGITGTEVAKEASDIVLMDDNFSSIVKAIMWGRTVNDAVKKFLQFQVTVSITTVMLTFVSAVADLKEKSVLTTVQLMWVSLIQDTLGALALATDPPAPSVLDRKPDLKSAPLISLTMWKMMIGQSIYQLATTLTLYFGGAKIFSYHSAYEIAQLQTAVFNTFVWMQIFNQYNYRRLDNKCNIFEGISRNMFFVAISLIMIGCQIIIIFVGGSSFSVTPLSPAQWGYSVILGGLSIPVGVVIRLIPDSPFERIYESFSMRKAAAITDLESQFQFRNP